MSQEGHCSATGRLYNGGQCGVASIQYSRTPEAALFVSGLFLICLGMIVMGYLLWKIGWLGFTNDACLNAGELLNLDFP